MRKFNFSINLELRISVWRTWSTSCNLDNIKAIQGAQIVYINNYSFFIYIYNYWEIFTFSDFCYFFEHPRCSNCQHILIQFVTLLKCVLPSDFPSMQKTPLSNFHQVYLSRSQTFISGASDHHEGWAILYALLTFRQHWLRDAHGTQGGVISILNPESINMIIS